MTPDNSSFNTENEDKLEMAQPYSQGATCNGFLVRVFERRHFMKRLKPEFARNPQYLAALRKEFEVGFNLDHPALPRYIQLADDYILMEFVDGLTLNEFQENNPQFFSKSANVDQLVLQLLDAVAYLHSHQVLHLDIKPSNIIITRIGNRLKLVDLGFCYSDNQPYSTGHTDAFAAPEQVSDSQTRMLDERTDIYAIGKVVEALPCADRYKWLSSKCVMPKPDERFQDVQQIITLFGKRRRRGMILRLVSVAAVLAVFFMLPFVLNRHRLSREDSIRQLPDSAVQTQDFDTVEANHDSLPLPQSGAGQSPQLDSEMQPNIQPAMSDVAVQVDGQAESHVKAAYSSESQTAISLPVHGQMNETTQDTLRLRKHIQNLIFPLFEKEFGSYEDSLFGEINQYEWSRKFRDFSHRAQRQYYSQIQRAFCSSLSEQTIKSEWSQTLRFCFENQCYRMSVNDPRYAETLGQAPYEYYDKPDY